jgi:molybdenum cofactor cytidylyltransferase
MEVDGVVLAAGRSERMGEVKALLRLGADTFLETAVRTLRAGGCARVVVVVADEAVAGAAVRTGSAVIRRGGAGGEQIDSLRAGLDAVSPGASAAVVLPVDHPLVRPETVGALVARHREDPTAIVRPVHNGRPGHPTLFPRSTWAALASDPLPRGARTLVESGDAPVVDVPVTDEGVLVDIDTPEDYRRHADH